MSAETAFADAVIARLKADSSVSAVLGGRVHAIAPGGTAYPFATLGQGMSTIAGGAGADLIDHRLTVHVYARRDDAERLSGALSAIRAALHNAPLALDPPHRCVLCQVVYTDRFNTSDSRIVQGLVRLRRCWRGRALTHPNSHHRRDPHGRSGGTGHIAENRRWRRAAGLRRRGGVAGAGDLAQCARH